MGAWFGRYEFTQQDGNVESAECLRFRLQFSTAVFADLTPITMIHVFALITVIFQPGS
jgi:hypothetical protein